MDLTYSNQSSIINLINAPPIFTDEDLLSYLQRLADINNYDRLIWIVYRSLQKQASSNYDDIHALVQNTSWTLYHQQDDLTQEINKLPAILKGKTHELRLCPQCLQEHRYYRAKWFLNTSTVCLKHKQELISKCPSCHSILLNKPHRIGICPTCKYDLATTHTYKKCSQLLLQLQSFIENHDLLFYEDADHRFSHRSIFQHNLEDRLQFIHFVLRWLPYNVKKKIEQLNKSSINQIDIAHEQLTTLTSIIFINRQSFINYLTDLQSFTAQEDTHKNYFIKFYRALYKNYPERNQVLHYKRIIEYFYRNYCVGLITQKHTLFSEELRTDQLWITLKQVYKQYGIERSALRFGISQGIVVAHKRQQGDREFTYCLRSSIEDSLEQLSSLISFKEACKILGVTKKQLYKLINHGLFTEIIAPKEGESSYWQFNAQELYLLLNQLFKQVNSFEGEKITIPDALRRVGNKIEEILPKILRAILNNEIRVDTTHFQPENIRGLSLNLCDFETLMAQYITKPSTLLTIPQLSHTLKINQEFAYQLINYNFLQYIQIDNTRFISQNHLLDFHKKYEILSHYSKNRQLSSQYLLVKLAEYNIYPVDHLWTKGHLRQKLFTKQEILFFENKFGAIL